VDAAYRPSAALAPGVFEANMVLYRERSAEAYRTLPHERDVCYDAPSGQCLDIFSAPGPGLKPVFVFIHGGYWRMLSKNESTFMAGALTRRGISVAIVDYTLAPAVKLPEIVRQVRRSIAWLYKNGSAHGLDPDRIFVGGSSAGGHLTGALVAGGWHEAFGLPDDAIKGAMPVSGVFDLLSLSKSFVNEWMAFDEQQIQELSPIRHLPPQPCKLVLTWGENETSGFKVQSRDYLAAWQGAGFSAEAIEIAGRNHFDVVLDWCDDDSQMTELCASMVLGTT
ncbi:MAG: alpha/beta hydrolase, partial [Pseudomonadota bacterium]|nr:alpha/beta hydrolase [Pseudomonadota bacterium]